MPDPHHHTPRRPRPAVAAALLASALAVAACGGTGEPTPSPANTPAPSPAVTPAGSPDPSPAPTEVPGGSTPAPPATVTPTTDTAWGPIWDDIPPAFPQFPGSQAGEPVEGPASAVFAAPADAATVAEWYQEALEQATYSTLSMSGPFEDGSIVIESMGETRECLVETTLRPESGSTIVTVLYGAGCPAPAG